MATALQKQRLEEKERLETSSLEVGDWLGGNVGTSYDYLLPRRAEERKAYTKRRRRNDIVNANNQAN